MTSLKFPRRFALSLLASLSAAVALALPTTALAVSDPNPPIVSNVTISATTVTAGSTLHVGYDVDDPDGVRSVTPIVESVSDGTDDGHGVSVRHAFTSKGDTVDGFDIPTSPDDRPFRYRVIGLSVTDVLGWVTDVYDAAYAEDKEIDCPTFVTEPLEYEVTEGRADQNPPTVSKVSLDSHEIMIGGKLHVSWQVSDPDGVKSVSPILKEVTGGSGDDHASVTVNTIKFSNSLGTDKGCDIPFDGTVDLGRYQIIALEVVDSLGYRTTVYDSAYIGDNGSACQTFPASDLIFDVTGSANDPHSPVVTDVSLSSKVIPVGKKLRISFNVSDPDGVRMVDVRFCDPGFIENPSTSVSSTSIRATYGDDGRDGYIDIEFPTTRSMGSYEIEGLRVLDKAGHETFVYSSAYAERNGKTGVRTFDVDDAGDVTFDVTAPLYAATKGDGQAYAKGGGFGLTFRFSGPLDEFTRLLVDGTEVSAGNYTATRGSTIIELRPAYLDTLAAGGHTVTAVWENGTATDASFIVDEKGQGGQTNGKTDVDSPGDNKSDPATPEKDADEASTKRSGRTTADEPKLAATGDSAWMASIALAMAATACFTAARRLEPKQHRHEQ